MKRIISLILALVMIASALTFISGGATSDGNHGFLRGDCNDDTKRTMKDVLLLRRYLANVAPVRDINLLAADVNEDTKVTTKDVLKLRRYLASLEDELPGNNTDSKYKVDVALIGGRNISRYYIFVPADADESMRYATRLFNIYLSGACGITLDIKTVRASEDDLVIEYRLDAEDKFGLGNEGYNVLVEDDGDLVITCGRLRGAMYATYYLLERFIGWRFLNADVEYLYKANKVELPIGYEDTEIPAFEYRGLNQVGTTNDDFAGLRLNALDARGSGSASNRKYGGGVGNLYIHGHSYEYQMAVGMKLAEEGVTDLDSEEAMDIFQIYGYNHQLHYDYVDEHDLWKQPCLTSDTTYDYIMAFNYLLYKERTLGRGAEPGFDYTMFSCSPNDTTAFCTCSNCKKVYSEEGSIAGTVFRMSNRVSEGMKEIDPRVGIYTIAYWDARNPPKYTRPNDDVCVCFCFGGCNNHTYDHVEECVAAGGNPRYPFKVWSIERQEVVDADFNVSNEYDLDCYNRWTELTNNVYVWYYACNFAYYIAPCPNVLNIYNDYKYLASTGTIGVYTEGSSDGYTFEVLRGYLAARMMWDPYMSEEEFEAYLDEFLMIYYGDGWEYIKQYVYMQDICGNLQGCFMNNFDRPWNFYNKEYYGQHYDEILALFNNAYDAAETKEQKKRVELARIHVYFLGLSATYERCWVNGSEAQKAQYQEQYAYLWNYINTGTYRVCDIGQSGKGGCGNFPKNSSTVYDTMFWIMDGFYGDGR